jgi:hypothetical protein
MALLIRTKLCKHEFYNLVFNVAHLIHQKLNRRKGTTKYENHTILVQ